MPNFDLMGKNRIKSIAQRVLGFDTYLYLFSLYKTKKALNGKYEKGFHYFTTLIPEKGVILDIGANIGITAIPLARLKNNQLVYAFEPIRENFETLQKVVNYYKLTNIILFQTALGNSKGSLRMIMPISSNARLQGLSKVCQDDSDEDGVYYDVQVDKLDDVIGRRETVSAIKIDVENFEYEVLKGAMYVLQRDKPIIYCELWNNDKRSKVFSFMKALGYHIFLYDEKSNNTIEIDEEYRSASNNFLFKYF